MSDQLTEFEGTWDQIAAHAQHFAGHKLRLIILPSEGFIEDASMRPENGTRTLDDKLADIAASIPPEEQAKLPSDLCDQLDHYIYGTPKR